MSKEVYYRLVDEQGALVPPASSIDDVEAILATSSTKVAVIRSRMIRTSSSGLPGANIHDLTIYPSDAARQINEPLSMEAPIGSYGDWGNPLIVVVASSFLDAPIHGMEKQEVQIDSVEFQLDQLEAMVGTLIDTPTLHQFWCGFGEFPSSYYVRTEEAMLWAVVKQQIPSLHVAPLVIVGSPGVGKSCFLMLLAFYIACTAHRKVLVIRRVKGIDRGEAVVFLNGPKSVAVSDTLVNVPVQRAVNLSLESLSTLQKSKDLLVFVDGFTSDEIKASRHLKLLDVLATSCQYDRKEDDPSRLVVLPAWRYGDLEKYVQSNRAWLVRTGYAKTENRTTPAGLKKVAAQQYSLSGGSMRLFCLNPAQVIDRMDLNFRRVSKTQAYALMYTEFGAVGPDQSDRLRRHYVLNPTNPGDYTSPSSWFVSVDSTFVVNELGRYDVPMEKHLEFYQYAASVGGGFHGIAYELLLHHCIRESIGKRNPVTIELRAEDPYERIELDVNAFRSGGRNKAECYNALTTLEDNTYWRPNYFRFPFVDAVSTCKAFPRGGGTPTHILAFIQMTIQNHKEYKSRARRVLDKKLEKNRNGLPPTTMYVVVTPKVATRDSFVLTKAPAAGAMVGCFEPPSLTGMEPPFVFGVPDEATPESDEEEVTSEDEASGDEIDEVSQ